MKKAKYLLSFLILLLIFQLIFMTTSFGVSKDSISVSSPSCILIESSTGKILYEKNANEVRYPASTTKIMTAILVLENCELSEAATVSHNAIYSIPADYVTANLKEGEELTVEQLLNVLLIPSANDAAIVLAEHVSGSVNKFADLMNEKAKEIGCKNTHFVNPNGIHNKNHTSTAYDLSLMAKYAMQNSTFREIVKKTKYTLPATNKYKKADRTFKTTNDLLIKNSKSNYYYPNATGVKTGYTGEAGNCLVSSAKKDNMEVIAVVLGAGFTKQGLSEKFLDSIALLDYAFDNYSIKTVQEKDSVVKEVHVSGATEETQELKVLVKDDIEFLCENDKSLETLKPEIVIDEKLKAPIATGSVVGKISYTVDGKTYSSDLVAGSNVLPSNFFPILLRVCMIIVTLYLIYLLVRPKKNNRRNSSHSKSSRSKNIVDSKSSRKKSSKSKRSKKTHQKGTGTYRYTILSNL